MKKSLLLLLVTQLVYAEKFVSTSDHVYRIWWTMHLGKKIKVIQHECGIFSGHEKEYVISNANSISKGRNKDFKLISENKDYINYESIKNIQGTFLFNSKKKCKEHLSQMLIKGYVKYKHDD